MLMRRRSLARYLAPAADPLRHFRIVWGETHPGFETLPCLLARAWADGRFELLNPRWEALGFGREGLAARRMSDLIALTPKGARKAIRSMLTEDACVEFGLRCNDGHVMRCRWHRQFDDFTSSLFIVGDELTAARMRPARPHVHSAMQLAGLSAA